MSNATLVSTTVNGDPVQFACPTDESLMTALRNRVGLTGDATALRRDEDIHLLGGLGQYQRFLETLAHHLRREALFE